MKPNSETIQCLYQPSHSKQIHKQRHLLLSLTALIFMLLCEVSAAADNGAFYLSKWGRQGTGSGQFEGPSGVAIDSAGYIYVADRANHRIQKFNGGREVDLEWGSYGSGDGQFINPRGIAVDSWGNVYVADEGNHRIQKFNSSGAFLQKWGSFGIGNGQFNRPYGVAVRGSSVYVADTQNHRIQKFTSTTYGAYFVAAWGNYGAGNAQFKAPRGVAVDSAGNVYVADTDNHRIQKFDKNTNAYLDQWGIAGSGNGQFNHPRGVAVDANGAVYVADTDNHSIQKFTSNGLYVGRWGGYGTDDGLFINPTSVAVGNGCAIIVSDTSNNRVQKFACDNSNYFVKWGGYGTGNGEFNHPSGIAVDSNGYVYVADDDNHRIQKFSSSGVYISQWGKQGGLPGNGPGEFNQPKDVAVDSAGYVYVADTFNDRIQKFTSTGTYVTQWPSQGSYVPITISVSSADIVYVNDVDGLYKYTLAGAFYGPVSHYYTDAQGNAMPLAPWSIAYDLREDGTGNVYVASGSPNYGNKVLSWNHGVFSQWEAAADRVVVDGAGNVYVIGIAANRIQKFTSSGVSLKQWGSSGTGNAQFNGPHGIAIDKNCNIYVVDRENHRIQKFSTLPLTLTFNW